MQLTGFHAASARTTTDTKRDTSRRTDAPAHPSGNLLDTTVLATFLVAAIAVSLFSCAAGERDVEPPVPIPEGFSIAGEEPLPHAWWLSFGDPRLSALIDVAVKDNLTLRAAWDRLAQAEAIARRAGADLTPSLDLEAGASLTARRTALANGSREKDEFNELSLGAAASYELDLWGRIRSTADAAALDARAGAEDLHAAAITLSAEVAAAWYGLVEMRTQVAILDEQLKNNEQVLELVTLRFRRGQVSAADVLRQRQLVESGRGAIAQAQAAAQVLEHRLAILLGRPPGDETIPREGALVSLPPLPETGIPADLVRRRPDIRRAYCNILAADHRVAAALAERYPRLTLSARLTTAGEKASDLFALWIASIAGSLVQPVLDGGSRAAEVDRARAALSEEIHLYGQAILEAFGEVEDALARERMQALYIDSVEKQLALSEAVVERVRDSYRSGAADYLDVLDALLSNQSLQRSLVEARRVRIEDRIDLCRALAGSFGIERPERNAAGDPDENPAGNGRHSSDG